MLTRALRFFAALWLLVAGSSALAAAISNGRFETGNFDGWTVVNSNWLRPYAPSYAAVVGADSGISPLQGDYSALLVAVSRWYGESLSSTCALDIWNVNCPVPISTPISPEGGPALTNAIFSWPLGSYLGGVIGQDFYARAGDELSWEWSMSCCGGDRMFAEVTDGSTVLEFQLGSLGEGWYSVWSVDWLPGYSYTHISSTQISSNDYNGYFGGTLWPRTASFTLPNDGTWTAYFGVAQEGDYYAWSAALLDNVRLRHISEPSSLALLSFGLVALGAIRRRRH